MTIFFLVRHGENDWVKKNRLAGWLPGVHLNENGRRQAQDAGAQGDGAQGVVEEEVVDERG